MVSVAGRSGIDYESENKNQVCAKPDRAYACRESQDRALCVPDCKA